MFAETMRSQVIAAACTSVLVAGCAAIQIQSTWRPGPESRGPASGSTQALFSHLDLKDTFIAIQNDSSEIQVELRTTDREIARTIMHRGLTFWFDPTGGKERRFGIHYPVGPRWNEASTAQGNEGGTVATAAPDLIELFEGGNDEPHRMTLAAAGGIDVSTRMQGDTMYYVLRVPLREDLKHPFAVLALPGTSIGLGIDSSPRLRNSPANKVETEGGGRDAGGRRRGGFGRRGNPPGGEGRGTRGNPAQIDQSFDVWARVSLAAAQQVK